MSTILSKWKKNIFASNVHLMNMFIKSMKQNIRLLIVWATFNINKGYIVVYKILLCKTRKVITVKMCFVYTDVAFL